MKVKSGRCDFDKIVIPHLQASFLSFLSFDLSVSCISLGSRFLFPLFFLVAHLTFSPFLFIVSICFCCSRSRSFLLLFFFIICFGSTFLSSQSNKYKRKLHLFYPLICLSFFPFFIVINFTIPTNGPITLISLY